jgi:site-specific recombinase XerC
MKPIPGPPYERLRTLERFGASLGHRDASAVAKADAVRFKEDMQARGRHASTVRNDMSELSAIRTHGIRNGKLASDANPFGGVSPPKPKRRRGSLGRSPMRRRSQSLKPHEARQAPCGGSLVFSA